jgi:threonine/homoserine/homoserine lactone efflux protein
MVDHDGRSVKKADMNGALPSLLAFSATTLVIELTPGPNMGYLAILTAREGRRAGFAATFGIALGLLLVGLAAALGLTAVVAASRWLYETLRWAGALYLLWLAWEGWRGEAEIADPDKPGSFANHSGFFVRGLITNLLNPKAGLFYMAILPTFVDADRPMLSQVVTLTTVYVAIATLVHSCIVLLAQAVRPWLAGETRRAVTRRLLSLLLAAIAVWLFFATKYPAR